MLAAHSLAAFEPEMIFPFAFAVLLFVVLPIVVMLIKHQQKMAELLHGRGNGQSSNVDHERLLHEIAHLRHVVSQQTLAIDGLRESQRRLEERMTEADDIRARLTG